MRLDKKKQNIIAVIIIVILGLIFHFSYINKQPTNIHAWAQVDRYALAKGFINNNYNLFKPETFVYNHQFPNNWTKPELTTITSVDFPIHDYNVAILMKILNNSSPWVFRLYILLYSFIGLYYLFKLSRLVTNSYYKSIIILLFAATSPVFVYYQSGFLPTIPSLSNAFIGIYFYIKYSRFKINKHFNIAILFLTISALSRTTFVIPLIAVLLVEGLYIVNKRTRIKAKIVPITISITIIISYYFHNQYLRTNFGSIFLNNLLPADNINQFNSIIITIKNIWLFQYLSVYHYIILTIILLIVIYITIKNKSKYSLNRFKLIIIAISLGDSIFFIMMIRQFVSHDYYYIDTFFLPIIFIFTLLLTKIPSVNNKYKYIYWGLIIISIMALVFNTIKSQKERYAEKAENKTTITLQNFKNSDIFLDSLKIPLNAKILVIDVFAPNLPFLLMNRKGYALMSSNKDNIKTALKWDFDYLIIPNKYFTSDKYYKYPQILSEISKIADNGLITIFKLSKKTCLTLSDLLKFNTKKPIYIKEFIGEKHGILTSKNDYSLIFRTTKLPEINAKNNSIIFTSQFYTKTKINDCFIVVDIKVNNKSFYYKYYELKYFISAKNKWQKVEMIFNFPEIKENNYEFSFYLWNKGNNNILIKNSNFKIY